MKTIVATVCMLAILSLAASAQIPTTLFGMGASTSTDMPKVTYGILSHPAVAWTLIEGTGRGIYNFKSMDSFVKNAPKDANGVALIDIPFGWTPGWAVADQTHCIKNNKTGMISCTNPPDNIQDWIDFITTVINHYNGVTAPHVKYYEIWNEMSNSKFWTGTPQQMVALAAAAYPILKQDPYSTVFTPSVVWLNGVKYMTSYLQAGGNLYADGLTFHGYSSQTGPGYTIPVPYPESPLSTNAPIVTMITTFRALADANGLQGKPIATTEGGWGTNGVVDSDQQIAWITHYEILQATVAAANNLLFQDWYTWGYVQSGDIETKTGVPTPAGLAYNVVLQWLIGTKPTTGCTQSGNIYTCQIASLKQIVWDASQDCNAGVCTTAPYNPDPSYLIMQDTTGLKQNIQNNTVNLGIKPILLVK